MTSTATFQLPKPADITSAWWGEQDEIGQAYLDMAADAHLLITREEERGWKALASETAYHARAVRQLFDVRITDDPEPYPTAREMCQSMRDTGVMLVSRANSTHPIWTIEQNIDFRIVHDGMGHYLSGGAFSWQGELDACGVHFRLVANPDARRALFTECIGQVAAYYALGGKHAPQVIGFLPHHFTKGKLHA
jgi:hypothetical protein